MSTAARLSLADYDRMIAAGVFDGARRRRLEFIEGEIREMSPIGPEHAELVARLDQWSHESLPRGRGRVWVQNPIDMPDLESVPEPDVAWVAPRDYRHQRPAAADVLLVIEVADTSLEYDSGEKAALYARAGIGDCWLVNLRDRSIEVRRDPANGRYRSLQTFAGDDEVRPLVAPEAVLRPAMLWAKA